MTDKPKNPARVTVTGRFTGGALFEPKEQQSGAEKYNACVVLDKGQEEKIEAAIEHVIQEKWKGKRPAGLQIWGVREGDDPDYEASYGKPMINPKNQNAPQRVIKRNGAFAEVTKQDDLLYAGCYVAVSVTVYGYDGDKKAGIKPGVSMDLRAVMFRKHGERLGDTVNAENEFDGFDTEEDGFDDDDGGDFV